jgi:manganese-dependent inorganic pyrophosphatase
MPDPILIFGHRNPDADAICSAIGYAHFKHLRGESHYEAARCGNSNARIDAILNRFHVPLPRFIGDVTPRVRDVMVRDVIRVTEQAICSDALALLDAHDVRTLAVTDSDNRLRGTLSIFDMGEYFIPKPNREMRMRHVFTNLSHILHALRADPVHVVDPDRDEELFVRIGAMDIRSFGSQYIGNPEVARSSVIIVGDRYDIQQRSIQSGVRLLVISGGLPVEPDVVSMARERGVSIIISPEDSATTSWIIRSAGKVNRLINTQPVKFGPDEKLSQVKRRLAMSKSTAFMVVDEENRLLGVFSKTDLLKPIATRIVLVDHNELSQAVPGADQVQILEVIDHHRLGNPPTNQPIFFYNAPLGSTSTLVADLMQKAGLQPEPPIAGVLMGGIISDTLHLKGPTTTERDCELLQWLSSIAGVSSPALADLMFNSGSVILSEPAIDVVRADMKVYEEGKVRFSVSQIEELGFDALWRKREELERALEAVLASENLLFSALLVTDINTQNSLLLIRGDEEVVRQISYPRRDAADIYDLQGVVSRKKQLLPYLSSLLHDLNAPN